MASQVIFWRFAVRYLLAITALNLLWEIAHLPLYTIWWEAGWGANAFAVLHCTLGDVMIGAGAAICSAMVLWAANNKYRNIGCPLLWRWRPSRLLSFTRAIVSTETLRSRKAGRTHL